MSRWTRYAGTLALSLALALAGCGGPSAPETGQPAPAVTPTANVIQGTVAEVDEATGRFVLYTDVYGTVTVTLPFDPRTSVTNRFRQLTEGDVVRLEGTFLNPQRFEIERFL